MKGKVFVWIIIAIAVALGVAVLLRTYVKRPVSLLRSIPIEGAVIRHDADPRNELPIADVVVTASDGVVSATTQSDASGYFKLILHRQVWSGQPIVVTFRHPDYEPFTLSLLAGRLEIEEKLYVADMVPLPLPATSSPSGRSPWFRIFA